jgi:hypothetical protein
MARAKRPPTRGKVTYGYTPGGPPEVEVLARVMRLLAEAPTVAERQERAAETGTEEQVGGTRRAA